MAAPTLVGTQCCTPCSGVQTVQVPGAPGATASPGADGVDGVNAYTLTTAAFVMPAHGANVSVLVADTSWMIEGQIVFVTIAGHMQVASIASANQVSLNNLESDAGAYASNAAPATAINSGSKVSPAGLQGLDGGTIYTAAGDIDLDGVGEPRINLATEKGSLIVGNGSVAVPRSQALAAGANRQILHCDAGDALGVSWRGLDLSGINSSLIGLLPRESGGTGAANAPAARISLGAAASGANADITSLSGLTTPLSPAQGGTGVAALQSFSAYKSGAETVASGSATKIQYDAENWDAATVYDATVQYRFTPTVAGKYRLTASVELTSLGTNKYVEVQIFKNGVVFACSPRFWNASGAVSNTVAAFAVDVDANGAADYFDARVYHNHGSNLNISADATRSFFNGHWCG